MAVYERTCKKRGRGKGRKGGGGEVEEGESDGYTFLYGVYSEKGYPFLNEYNSLTNKGRWFRRHSFVRLSLVHLRL